MFNNKEYIGISYDGELIRIASVSLEKSRLKVERLDTIKPVTPLENAIKQAQQDQPEQDEPFDMMDTELDADSIFGLDDDLDEDDDDLLGEIDLSDIEDDTIETDDSIDLVQESGSQTNDMLLFEYLQIFGKSKKNLVVNVPSGDTIFQILSDSNYKDLKKKELVDLIEDKLNSIYGGMPDKNNYDYLIRENGTLVIASIDQEPPVLKLLNDIRSSNSSNTHFITDVVCDESVMVGLYKSNYEIEEDESITGLLQLGPHRSRILFMRGNQVLQISPVINEGTKNKSYLNTIFSKLLFQLDTGEIPGLDKLLIFNNTEGNKALDFFRKSFTDLIVEDFKFNEDKVLFDSELEKEPRNFTTTIGLAAIAARYDTNLYPKISFIPDYVKDQQKVFRLQWHGVVLLLLIGLSPILLNHFYQQNSSEIDSLQSQADRLQTSITELRPLVQQAEDLSAQLSTMQEQLDLLTELSEDNIRWTTTLDLFNRAVNETGGLWINSVRQSDDVLMVDGYALQQARIPELARKFESVTLLNVRKQEVRERDVYFFTMMIREITGDKSLYTPDFARDFIESN